VYAVIATGGRQYKVSLGEVIEVNRLPVEQGQTIDLDSVLLIGSDEGTLIGQPTVAGAVVRARVSGNFRSRKQIVFKYKSKVRHRVFNTHRQDLTRLVIKEILTAAEVEAKANAAAEATPSVTEANADVTNTSADAMEPSATAAESAADLNEASADAVETSAAVAEETTGNAVEPGAGAVAE
jgi:large subunit ribosomal protein L21